METHIRQFLMNDRKQCFCAVIGRKDNDIMEGIHQWNADFFFLISAEKNKKKNVGAHKNCLY